MKIKEFLDCMITTSYKKNKAGNEKGTRYGWTLERKMLDSTVMYKLGHEMKSPLIHAPSASTYLWFSHEKRMALIDEIVQHHSECGETDGLAGWPIFSLLDENRLTMKVEILASTTMSVDVLNRKIRKYEIVKANNNDSTFAFLNLQQELINRLILPHPGDTLTASFYGYNSKLKNDYRAREYVRRLYCNELMIINRWIILDWIDCLNDLKMPREKIQQILRGNASMKYMQIMFEPKLRFTAGSIMAIGTLVWPVNYLDQVVAILKAHNDGLYGSTEFKKRIVNLRNSLKGNIAFDL
ncbi:MAG: hypothetical protein HQK52_23880 [Oligoflexia bacterium]|nr:hypothetical protein [Oligoflexia bacterium]